MQVLLKKNSNAQNPNLYLNHSCSLYLTVSHNGQEQTKHRTDIEKGDLMRSKKNKTRTYRFLFPIVLSGCGATAKEAWQDATEAFALDPGCYDKFKREEEIK